MEVGFLYHSRHASKTKKYSGQSRVKHNMCRVVTKGSYIGKNIFYSCTLLTFSEIIKLLKLCEKCFKT